MYKINHLADDNKFKCEFNLEKLFSENFTGETKYKEDVKPCGEKAEYKVSDKYHDYWMCRKHLYSLFPTAWTELKNKENGQNLRKITRNKK